MCQFDHENCYFKINPLLACLLCSCSIRQLFYFTKSLLFIVFNVSYSLCVCVCECAYVCVRVRLVRVWEKKKESKTKVKKHVISNDIPLGRHSESSFISVTWAVQIQKTFIIHRIYHRWYMNRDIWVPKKKRRESVLNRGRGIMKQQEWGKYMNYICALIIYVNSYQYIYVLTLKFKDWFMVAPTGVLICLSLLYIHIYFALRENYGHWSILWAGGIPFIEQ